MSVEPNIKKIAVIAKLDNKKVHQILLTKVELDLILNYIYKIRNFDKIKILEQELEGLTLD